MRRLMNLFKSSSKSRRSAADSRRSFKPVLESLEDRQLPSSAGVISAITDGGGRTTLFAIQSDGRVWEKYQPGTYPSQWTALSSPWDGTFRELSAGLDESGHAHCYAINSATGNLWEFDSNHLYVNGPYPYWYIDNGHNVGGVCLDLSATVNNNCYVIGTGHMLYYYTPASQFTYVISPTDGVVHISAGVDAWGRDEVYMIDTYGYVLPATEGTTVNWLRDSQGHYLRASQVSAGIGSNNTGVDLYYVGRWDLSLHYFDGWTDTRLGLSYVSEISASVDQNGTRDYKSLGNPGQFEFAGTALQISAAKSDLVFTVYDIDTILEYYPGWFAGQPCFWSYDTGGVSAYLY
jgi:hypothetical protein